MVVESTLLRSIYCPQQIPSAQTPYLSYCIYFGQIRRLPVVVHIHWSNSYPTLNISYASPKCVPYVPEILCIYIGESLASSNILMFTIYLIKFISLNYSTKLHCYWLIPYWIWSKIYYADFTSTWHLPNNFNRVIYIS